MKSNPPFLTRKRNSLNERPPTYWILHFVCFVVSIPAVLMISV